jgi:hypothetical protein
MHLHVRLKYETGVRAHGFCIAVPFDNPSHLEIVGQLGERIARLERFAEEELAGQLAVRSATAVKARLRHEIREQLLRHLVAIFNATMARKPDLLPAFGLLRQNCNEQAFLTDAHCLLQLASRHESVLIGFGMFPNFVAELTSALARYDAAIRAANKGGFSHVGANAGQRRMADEILALVHLLDGINVYRFRDDPERRAAWDSVKRVAWPDRTPRQITPPTPRSLPVVSTVSTAMIAGPAPTSAWAMLKSVTSRLLLPRSTG